MRSFTLNLYSFRKHRPEVDDDDAVAADDTEAEKIGSMPSPKTTIGQFASLEDALKQGWALMADLSFRDPADMPMTRHLLIDETDTEDGTLRVEWESYAEGDVGRTVWIGGLGYNIELGDELPDAGTKFAQGSLVSFHGQPDEVLVVAALPTKRTDQPWENIYRLESVTSEGHWYHTHCHEKHLMACNGPITPPLIVLSRIYSGVWGPVENFEQLLYEDTLILNNDTCAQLLGNNGKLSDEAQNAL